MTYKIRNCKICGKKDKVVKFFSAFWQGDIWACKECFLEESKKEAGA